MFVGHPAGVPARILSVPKLLRNWFQESPLQTKERAKTISSWFHPFLWILVFLLGKTSAIHIKLLFRFAPGKSSWTGLSLVWFAGVTPDNLFSISEISKLHYGTRIFLPDAQVATNYGMEISESVKCRFSKCRFSALNLKFDFISDGGCTFEKQIQKALGSLPPCGNRCRFSESAICSSRVHPPSEIKSNTKFKTLRWRPLRWRLTLSENHSNLL